MNLGSYTFFSLNIEAFKITNPCYKAIIYPLLLLKRGNF